MEKPKQIIIIGGGPSIKEGINKGLWNKIKNKFVIGLNYSFEDFYSTIQCFVDKDFYNDNKDKLKNLPLIIGKKFKRQKPLPNTLAFNTPTKYKRDLSNGIYKSSLVGIFSISLAVYLLDRWNGKETFLIGFDQGVKNKEKDDKGRYITHYYQDDKDRNHRGVGKTNYYYSKDRDKKDFGPFAYINDIQIYNVSLHSRISESIFQKISYDEMFNKLNNKTYNQDNLRAEILEEMLKLQERIRINLKGR